MEYIKSCFCFSNKYLSSEKILVGEFGYYSSLLVDKNERQKNLKKACHIHGEKYMLYRMTGMQISWEKLNEHCFNIITEDIHYIQNNLLKDKNINVDIDKENAHLRKSLFI